MIETTIIGKVPDLDKEFSKPLGRAVRNAISTAVRDMKATATQNVRQRKRLRAKAVRAALKARFAKGSSIAKMQGSLLVSNEHARVADYPHRQTKRGVSVEINRGKRTLIRGGFKATMRSGHKGVYVRAAAAKGVPVDNPRGSYTGARRVRRLPISEVLASRVIDAVMHQGEISAIQKRGQESFAKTLDRVLPLELAKVTP